jgi:hypothetical protein
MATLFLPLLVYVFLKHVTRDFDDDALPDGVSASTLAFPLVSLAILLIHPQATVNVIILFGAVVGVQWLYRRVRPANPISHYRPIYGQFAFLTVMFAVWALQHDEAGRTAEAILEAVGKLLGGGEAAENVDSQTDSADSIGVSIVELYAKLFLASTMYVLTTAGLVLAKLSGSLAEGPERKNGTIVYFTFGGLALLPYIVVHSYGKVNAYLFRHVGFGMALATILGAVAFFYLVRRFEGSVSRSVKPVLIVVAALALVLSTATVFALAIEDGTLEVTRYEG